MKLTEIAIRRPAFMTMIFVALAVIGLFSYSIMGVDFLPKMEFPWVMVSIVYPGAGPKEVESQIAKPVEEALSSISNLKTLRTYSNENMAFALMEFQMSTDVNEALSDVDRKINEIKINLPKEILQPQVAKMNMNAIPILRIAVTSNLDNEKFYQLMKDKLKSKIEQVEGVAGITLVGGKEREIRIELDNDKLKSYNLSIIQVTQILGSENIDFPTGKIDEKDKNYTVRLAGKFQDLETIRNLTIASTPSGTIRLKDIGQVLDTYKETYTYSRLDGTSGMGLIIQKSSDANSIKTSDEVHKVIKKLEKEYAANEIKFTISQDLTEFTRTSLNEVFRDLGLAICMVAIVLFFFLHDIKNALIVLLSIPTSLISTFIMMNILGFTINLITLMALTLVIGILVDDSIVVLENIHRHLEKGEPPKEAALNGRSEIGMAAIAITLVDVVVFLPIAMVGGMVGKIFREFGLTIVCSTLFSLFVSFTLTPLLASRWSKMKTLLTDEKTKENKVSFLNRLTNSFERIEKNLADSYRKLLGWALNHRKTVLFVSTVLLLTSLSFVPAGLIGTEFMPELDRGEFAIDIEMPLGTSIDKTNNAVLILENWISDHPSVVRYYTVVGRSEGQQGDMRRTHVGQVQVKLVPEKKRKPTQEIITEFINMAQTIPGVKARASLIGMWGTADEAPIYMEVKGDDLEKLIRESDKVFNIVSHVKGTRDVKSSWEEGVPEVKILVDRTRCSNYNLTLGEVGMAIRNSLEGDISTKYKEGDTEYDMRIMLAKKNRENPDDVRNIMILNRLGQQVRLSDVAAVYIGKGPAQIQRKDKSRVVTITSNLDNSRPLSEVVNEIQKKVKDLKLPPDINVVEAGAAEEMNNMFKDMFLAIFFAIMFVYMIMVSLYESYLNPFIIMFALPMALFGAFLALFLVGLNLNTFSMIGVLMSMGLVTKNAILLVDFTNQLRKRGLSLREALLEAGPVRLRPIVMTTTTMIIGMMPLALGVSGAGDMRKALAVIVIGGLVSSTLLTLVLVPIIYTIMDGWKAKITKLLNKLGWLNMKQPIVLSD